MGPVRQNAIQRTVRSKMCNKSALLNTPTLAGRGVTGLHGNGRKIEVAEVA